MKLKIRKGDTVEVISGRKADKGERGEVLKVYLEKSRITVQGINIKKNTRVKFKPKAEQCLPELLNLKGQSIFPM